MAFIVYFWSTKYSYDSKRIDQFFWFTFRSKVDYSDLHKQLDTVIEERDNYQKEIEIIKRHNSDDFYLPQIKEVCYVILGTFWTFCQKEANGVRVRVVVFDATFNNISVVSWRSVLLVDETRVPGENHCSAASHWQSLSIEYNSPEGDSNSQH